MVSRIDSKAWGILNEDEKTALSLSLGYGKSTWESGEILGKAHFKYLEIQKRAQKFLEVFTNHFEKYGGLFPKDITIPSSFREFLSLTILERQNISNTVNKMSNTKYLITSARNKFIEKEIYKLKMDPSEGAIDLYNLIMDFDRWNNFRILPPSLQEPSAFKRRNKARNIKHIRNITSLPEYSIVTLIERFHYDGKYSKLYLPIISKYFPIGYRIVPIKDKPGRIEKITSIGLFLFADKDKAKEFGESVNNYFLESKRTCKSGQNFWPKFRALMAEARNFKDLENIHKSRTYLDNAIFLKGEETRDKKSRKKV